MRWDATARFRVSSHAFTPSTARRTSHRTPHVAVIVNCVGGAIIALLLGWKWGPLSAFATIATGITVVVILIYMAVCVGSIVYYRRERPDEWSPIYHGLFPVLGAVIFFFPLYYQYTDPPDYPLGVVVLLWVSRSRPEALERADRIFIEEGPEPGFAAPVHDPAREE